MINDGCLCCLMSIKTILAKRNLLFKIIKKDFFKFFLFCLDTKETKNQA